MEKPVVGPLIETVISAEQNLGNQCDSLDGMMEETAALSEEINEILYRIRQKEGGVCSSDMSISELMRSKMPMQPSSMQDRMQWR